MSLRHVDARLARPPLHRDPFDRMLVAVEPGLALVACIAKPGA